MAKFKYIGDMRGTLRVLLDGGGQKHIDGVLHKQPARWADFGKSSDKIVEINEPAQIKVMMSSPHFGKDIVLVPEKVVKKKLVPSME